MESEVVRAARRQLDALSRENNERLSMATQRMNESDAKAAEANAQQRTSIQKLVKRLREAPANREKLARENRETFAFGRTEEASAVGSSRRWPGTAARPGDEAEQRTPDDGDRKRPGARPAEPPRPAERGGSTAKPAEAERPAAWRKQPAPERPQIDDEDMSGQSWMR